MDARNNDFDFDFTPIGQAIKKARTSQGITREQLARIVDYDPRHLQAIENEGQYPSLELFIQLVTMFNISVDEYIFPQKEVKKSSVRRRLDAQLDILDDRELSVIEAFLNLSSHRQLRGFLVLVLLKKFHRVNPPYKLNISSKSSSDRSS